MTVRQVSFAEWCRIISEEKMHRAESRHKVNDDLSRSKSIIFDRLVMILTVGLLSVFFVPVAFLFIGGSGGVLVLSVVLWGQLVFFPYLVGSIFATLWKLF